MPEQRDDRRLIEEFVGKINAHDLEGLTALADPAIELIGPRGVGSGHQLLRDWMNRANMKLETFGVYGREGRYVLAQHGIWHTPEGEPTSEADTWMRLHVAPDGQTVTRMARYESLEEALAATDLRAEDALAWG